MATTVSLSYEDTFLVFDFVTRDPIGEVSLMSDGWAAYRVGTTRRIGTYPHAEDAIRAVDHKFKLDRQAKRANA